MSDEDSKTTPEAKRLPAWGDALVKLDAKWVRLETMLAVAIVLVEMLSLCAWVGLKGLSSPPEANAAGLVFRAALTGTALGGLAWVALKKQPERLRSAGTTVAVCVGLFLGRLWVRVGVGYTAELVGWYQEASLLALVGGLRAVGTRCTIWLAMLGASLATSSGKHINIDVVMRFLSPRLRVPAAVAAWLAAALVCIAAAWGFLDHIAITAFGAAPKAPMSAKIAKVVHESGEHWFVFRRQAEIDSRVGWRVLAGTKYGRAMPAAEWNELITKGGWDKYHAPDEVKGMMATPGTDYVRPLLILPGGRSTKGLLVEDLNLLFPFGFFVIALKFVLRALLVVSGHIEVDPDAMHREDGHEPEPEEGPPPDDAPPPATLASPAQKEST